MRTTLKYVSVNFDVLMAVVICVEIPCYMHDMNLVAYHPSVRIELEESSQRIPNSSVLFFVFKKDLDHNPYSRLYFRIIKVIEIMNFKSMFLILAMIICPTLASAQQSNCSKCHRLIASGRINFKSHLGRACASYLASPMCIDKNGFPTWRKIKGNGLVF